VTKFAGITNCAGMTKSASTTKSAGTTNSAGMAHFVDVTNFAGVTNFVATARSVRLAIQNRYIRRAFSPLVIAIMIYDSPFDSPLITKLPECKTSQGIANPVLSSST
jgi:hypothetical protein